MAEILLSLTIIGVVAAITLPSLTGNINERTWNTQRKALYARFSQAIALMPALNGYGTLTESESHSITADTAAETFVTDGLSKVLKMNNICDSEHLEDCGLPSKITALNGSIAFSSFPKTFVSFNEKFNFKDLYLSESHSGLSYSQTDTKSAAFETANGESIAVFYNPRCNDRLSSGVWSKAQPSICANFVYDLNGNKGPNTMGKDIGFITVLYNSDSAVVAPMPLTGGILNSNLSNASKTCTNFDSESRLPTSEEAAAMFTNKNLLGYDVYAIWTSSKYEKGKNWAQFFDIGARDYSQTESFVSQVWCVKR